ncbi:MAG: TolC family protein [Planctomycetes bacterium]|nr:TolC family protein [Planctomycetota bacterium]NOG52978.1 TolC family protein [Planctomycetota bacterium]
MSKTTRVISRLVSERRRHHWWGVCFIAACTGLAGCQPGPLSAESDALRPAALDQPDSVYGRLATTWKDVRSGESTADDGDLLPEHPELAHYQQYAALHNAGLKASFADLQAALEQLPQVAALPDPRLTYGLYLQEVETRVGPMQHQVSIAQTFPWFGKLHEKESAAARAARAAYYRLEQQRLSLRHQVAAAYFELYRLDREIKLTEETVELLLQVEQIATARYRVDSATHPDLIRIQMQLSKMDERVRSLRDRQQPAVAAFNALLNREVDAVVEWPSRIDGGSDLDDVSHLTQRAMVSNPGLRALTELIERERINMKLARLDGKPDFTFGLMYTVVDEAENPSMPESGKDPVMASVSVNLPIWREKYDAGARQAVARRLALSHRRAEQERHLTTSIEQTHYRWREACRTIELYRNVLTPRATESMEAILVAFQNGESGFLDVLDAEQTLLEFQLALDKAEVERAVAASEIDMLVGTGLLQDDQRKDTGQ